MLQMLHLIQNSLKIYHTHRSVIYYYKDRYKHINVLRRNSEQITESTTINL